ncbi:MAG TPA: hypothetical protein VJL58_10995, partial [Pyrinomonadaceae bacterium]|nr:hypothetical protein [Pyrinomonadaceae bacterium]
MEYFKIWFIVVSCLAASLGVRAQETEIPAEKKETIRKILIATKAVENKREAFEYSLKDFEGLF